VNKKIILLIFVGLFGLTSFVLAQQVTIKNPLSAENFGQLLLQIAGAVGALVGALGTIMIIVAGILYLTSAGSPERMKTAKTALVYAIAGIAIGIAATAIVEVIKSVLVVKP